MDRFTPPTPSLERFRTGTGFAWGAHDEHVLGGCERFFRPGYLNHLASAWIPALDGVEAKLTAGARIADVGCGHGASTVLLAEAYPASTVVGFDADDGSIDAARKRAADAGLADRVRFEVASATTFAGDYDLVCFFDCLHDMGDPAGACAHVRDHLAPRRHAHAHRAVRQRRPERQPQPGRRRLLRVLDPALHAELAVPGRGQRAGRAGRRGPSCGRSSPAAGFTTLRRVAETPFNIVLEATSVMKFAQIIEFRTTRIDEFNAHLDAWMTRTTETHPASRSPEAGPRRRGPIPADGGVLFLRRAWRTPPAPRQRSSLRSWPGSPTVP